MSASILVVDDDKQLRTLYRMVLERAGYEVDEATNGAEALRYLMSYVPDVIVMDMLMPMLGGEAVMQRIQTMPSLQDIRIVVLTAYPRFRESSAFMQADAFLVKPTKPDALINAVKRVLGKSSEAGSDPDPATE